MWERAGNPWAPPRRTFRSKIYSILRTSPACFYVNTAPFFYRQTFRSSRALRLLTLSPSPLTLPVTHNYVYSHGRHGFIVTVWNRGLSLGSGLSSSFLNPSKKNNFTVCKARTDPKEGCENELFWIFISKCFCRCIFFFAIVELGLQMSFWKRQTWVIRLDLHSVLLEVGPWELVLLTRPIDLVIILWMCLPLVKNGS